MSKPTRIVALLPMKAHSERVKGKNFRLFNGKPLFRWILDTLLGVPEIERVVINTDAKEILAGHGLSSDARVLIRDRKPQLCGDMVSMNLILEDDIKAIEADCYVMTHTTNPLLTVATVRDAIHRFELATARDEADSLFTVNRFQTRFYREDGSPVNHDPNNLVRTQDLEPWYEENSNLYVFTRTSFSSTHARIGLRPMMFETPRLQSFDIDDQTGWDMAEMVCRYLCEGGRK